jgi:hypothetical protein
MWLVRGQPRGSSRILVNDFHSTLRWNYWCLLLQPFPFVDTINKLMFLGVDRIATHLRSSKILDFAMQLTFGVSGDKGARFLAYVVRGAQDADFRSVGRGS